MRKEISLILKIIKAINIKENLLNILESKYNESDIYVITGEYISFKIAGNLLLNNAKAKIIKGYDNDLFLRGLHPQIKNKDLVIGIGGGVIVDISKELSYQSGADLIIIPTVLTNDGLASGLVVLKSVNSGKSNFRKTADYILVDLKIIEQTPKEFLTSSVGELFSKYSSINDWLVDNKTCKTDIETKNNILLLLEVFESNNYHKSEHIFDSLICSGKAINLQENSSPSSGSEHLIYHALYNKKVLQDVKHGTAVASISIFTLFLQKKLNNKHLQLINRLNIPLDFVELSSTKSLNLYSIFDYAKNYKKNRNTILNKYTIEELIEKYSEFKNTIVNDRPNFTNNLNIAKNWE